MYAVERLGKYIVGVTGIIMNGTVSGIPMSDHIVLCNRRMVNFMQQMCCHF